MIKIHEVIKGEDYYTVTFSEGLDAYGIIITLMPDQPVYLEFMEFDKNRKDLIVVTEKGSPEEFKRLKETYFDKIMAHIKGHSN